MMMKSALFKRRLHVAQTPRHLHGMPTRAWNLRLCPNMHTPRQFDIGKKPSHTLCLHTGLLVDGRQFTPGHLIQPIPVKPPPPPPTNWCARYGHILESG